MAGRSISHSNSRWQQLPPTIVRCNGTLQSGKRCRREAIEGSVVCEIHGGLAPQVRRRAAERVLLTADEAIQVIKSFISDPTVPAGVRLKAAQDLADRAGLAAAQVHKILPVDADPVLAFFEGILEQDGLTAPAALDPASEEDQPRELESGDLDSYGQGTRYDEEDHEEAESAEVITTEPEPERQHSDTPPRLFPPEVAPSRRRPS